MKKPEPRAPRTPKKPAPPRKPKQRPRKSDPTPDPLTGVEYTGNAEIDSATEFAAMQDAYRQRAKREQERFIAATDSEYWFCVSFQDREEKERFLKAIGMGRPRDPDKYMTGDQLADALGISY